MQRLRRIRRPPLFCQQEETATAATLIHFIFWWFTLPCCREVSSIEHFIQLQTNIKKQSLLHEKLCHICCVLYATEELLIPFRTIMIQTSQKYRLKICAEVYIPYANCCSILWLSFQWFVLSSFPLPVHDFKGRLNTSYMFFGTIYVEDRIFSALQEVKQHIVLGQIPLYAEMHDQYTHLQNQGPRSRAFLCMRIHQETTAPHFQQLARFHSPGTTFNTSTLAFDLKSLLLITFIPLELVTVMFPSAAWLWVMNVALPNRQAGTSLPVRMPDVTKKIS